jgi:dolichyl-phosphate beta-glucosyltransferase
MQQQRLLSILLWVFLGGSNGWHNIQLHCHRCLSYQRLRSTVSLRDLCSSVTGIFEEKLPQLVILIPAYNEAERIPSTLKCYQEQLQVPPLLTLFGSSSNILVVDDGSSDNTTKVVETTFPNNVTCLTLPQNMGKGAALAHGIAHLLTLQHSTENLLILTQDADGSGDLKYVPHMLKMLSKLLEQKEGDNDNASTNWSEPAMVVGNRNYNLFSARGITRWGFQTVVKLVMSNQLRVQDSQCGYKLMTLPAARALYKDLHLPGWSHDVEVLYRASLLDIPIAEMPIDWEDQDGSKVVASGVTKVSLQMLWDVLLLRWNYSVTKYWQVDREDD